jgi:hypothetical protein
MAQQAFGGQAPMAPAAANVHVTGRRVLAAIVDGIVLAVIVGVISVLFGSAAVEAG